MSWNVPVAQIFAPFFYGVNSNLSFLFKRGGTLVSVKGNAHFNDMFELPNKRKASLSPETKELSRKDKKAAKKEQKSKKQKWTEGQDAIKCISK